MKKCLLFLFSLCLSVPALAQQTLPPATTPYYDFTQGVKLNGSWGTAGECLVSNGGGADWAACLGLPGLTTDGALGIDVQGAGTFGTKVAISDACGVSDLNDFDNINAACFSPGGTPEAKISAALNFMYTTMGLNKGSVNTCKISMTGPLTLTTDPFASVRNASSNFQVHVKFCSNLLLGPNLLNGTYTGGQLGFVLPGGMVMDGDSTHPLPSPPYPNAEGATIQPLNSNYSGPLISMGSNMDNNNPMGVRLTGAAVTCLAPGEAYTTSTFNISAWSITGGSVPYTACYTTSAQSLQAGQLFSLSNFGTTTAFNGILGNKLIALAAGLSSTQVCALTDISPGSATEAGTGTVGRNTTAILNANAQELSKTQNVNIAGCEVGYDNEIDPLNGVHPHSGFDSLGCEGCNVTLPKDPNAVGVIIGVFSPSQMADFGTLKGMTIQGSNSGGGPSTGTGIWVENAARGRFADIHIDYIPYVVQAGTLASTNTLTFENVVNGSSNSTYSWQEGYYIGPKFGYSLNIIGGSMLGIAGTGARTLYDATYPGAPCTILATGESSIGFYSKGFGGGTNQVISSTGRTGCTSSVNPNLATLTGNNVFTGQNVFNNIVHHGSLGTTPATNLGSNILAFDVWCGSCTIPATYSENDFLNLGSGATPVITRYFDPPTSPPGSTVLQLGGVLRSWTETRNGNATNPTIFRQWGAFDLYNAAGTFFANFVPTLTATRTDNIPDGTAGLVLTQTFTTTAAATDAFTLQGVTSSSHCVFSAANAAAATNIATSSLGTLAANTINFTHTATANMNYTFMCTGF